MGLRVFVVRHGETEWSRERRFSGSREVPLTDLGRRQADAVGLALAGEPVAAVYTSPQERARTSAEPVAKPHRLELTIAPELREMAFGEWEGLAADELAARWPDLAGRWRSDPDKVTPSGGESLVAVAERVGALLAAIRAAHDGATVVLVSHAIVIRLVVLEALGLPADRLWSLDASPAGITEIEYLPGWTTVHRMNTLAHLRGLDA